MGTSKVDSNAKELYTVRLATWYSNVKGTCPVDYRTIMNGKTKFNSGIHVRNLGLLVASKEDLGKRLKVLVRVSRPGDRRNGGTASRAPTSATAATTTARTGRRRMAASTS